MKKKETAFDALARISELEEENFKLKRQNKILRYENMSQCEKWGAERAFRIFTGKDGEFIHELEAFKCLYIDEKDGELPFD